MWRKIQANAPLSVLSLLFLAGGMVTLGYFYMEIGRAANSADWRRTTGELLKCRVTERRSSSGSGRYGQSNRIETVTYGLDVEYDYETAGIPRRGQRFYFGPRTGDRDFWEEKANRYCANRSVEVYYDPRNPDISVLEPGGGVNNYIFILMGIGFLAYGIFLAWKIIREEAPQHSQS